MRKNKPYVLGLVLFLLLSFSCNDDIGDVGNESIHKQEVLGYLDNLKDVSDTEAKHKIISNSDRLDFRKITEIRVASNETMLIVDIRDLDWLPSSTNKAVFFLNDGTIVRSNIVSIITNQEVTGKLLASVFTGAFHGQAFSGKISVYSFAEVLNFFSHVENGKIQQSGTLNRKPKKGSNQGRTAGCIDWYLVTTTYYSNGTRSTSDQYMFTTCDSDCNTTKKVNGRVNCDGGGYTPGTAGPVFPSVASNGDRYQYRKPNGETIEYIFVGSLNAWVTYLITLPEAVIQSNPGQYPELATDGPLDGQFILTGDGFIYEYSAYTGVWLGSDAFVIPGAVDKTPITLSQFLDCFGTNSTSSSYKITVFVEEPAPGNEDTKVGVNVGHTFIGLTKTTNGQETTQYIGFYPVTKSLSYPIESKIVNNEETPWTISVSFDVDAHEFDDALYAARTNASRQYDISGYNCTDYAFSICDAAGISMPKGTSEFPLGYGSGHSPGRLGLDLRMATPPGGNPNSNGGFSGNSHGPCQ